MNFRTYLSVLIGLLISFVVFAEPSTDVIVARDRLETYSGKSGAVFVADEIHLQANQTLRFNEPATLYVKKLSLENTSKIEDPGHRLNVMVMKELQSDEGSLDISFDNLQNTSGADGQNGMDGLKAMDALKGGSGVAGSNGTSGTNGGDGRSITIIAPYLRGNVRLITRGGHGGNGGSGGSGGSGGAGLGGSDARTLYYFKYLDTQSPTQLLQLGGLIGIPYLGQVLAVLAIFNGVKIGDGFDGYNGGNGGLGGDGGSGGNGGNGGDIRLVFGQQVLGSKILSETQGGRGGLGGRAGHGGIGGPGGEGGHRGDIWAREGRPGASGLAGSNGADGRPGLPGKSGNIRISETNDPAWVSCYVKYRELMDIGEDPSFAQEALRTCPRQTES